MRTVSTFGVIILHKKSYICTTIHLVQPFCKCSWPVIDHVMLVFLKKWGILCENAEIEPTRIVGGVSLISVHQKSSSCRGPGEEKITSEQ